MCFNLRTTDITPSVTNSTINAVDALNYHLTTKIVSKIPETFKEIAVRRIY